MNVPKLGRMIAGMLVAAAWGATSNSVAHARQLPPILETVRVTVPPVLVFQVNDISLATDASTGATFVSFDQALLTPGRALRISVAAEGEMARSDGGTVPTATITWRTSSTSNGAGMNGTLSKTAFTPVFQSNPLVTSGSATLTWSITLSGTSMHAGMHQVRLRWRIESVLP